MSFWALAVKLESQKTRKQKNAILLLKMQSDLLPNKPINLTAVHSATGNTNIVYSSRNVYSTGYIFCMKQQKEQTKQGDKESLYFVISMHPCLFLFKKTIHPPTESPKTLSWITMGVFLFLKWISVICFLFSIYTHSHQTPILFIHTIAILCFISFPIFSPTQRFRAVCNMT